MHQTHRVCIIQSWLLSLPRSRNKTSEFFAPQLNFSIESNQKKKIQDFCSESYKDERGPSYKVAYNKTKCNLFMNMHSENESL